MAAGGLLVARGRVRHPVGAGGGAVTRIVILGGADSGAGKLARQLADRLGTVPAHTQAVYNLPWSQQSDAVAEWMEEPGPWVIAGPVGARALRKRLEAIEDEPMRYAPCDLLLYLPQSPAVPRHVRAKNRQLESIFEAVRGPIQELGGRVEVLTTTREKLDFGRKWRPER